MILDTMKPTNDCADMYTNFYSGAPVIGGKNFIQTPLIEPDILNKQGTGFLEESPGNRSAMRLMCMMALFSAIVFGALTMLRSNGAPTQAANGATTTTFIPQRDDTGLTLTFGFLIAAFAPKAVQKFAEQRLRAYVPVPGSFPSTLATAVGTMATPAVAMPVAEMTTVASATEDPRLTALQREIDALRAKLAQQVVPQPVVPQVPQPAPTSINGTALSAPVATPLQQIRQAGTL